VSTKKDERTGLFILNTGNGKGKTTAALGTLMRAYGRGMKVVMLQFIKHKDSRFGEHMAAEKMGVEIVPLGNGFTWQHEKMEKDRQLARKCWEFCLDKLLNSDYDVVILDELTYALTYRWLSISEVLDAIALRPRWMHVVITGRDATPELVNAADIVTEMVEIKHPFKKGVTGQIGIEF
jgi:cob(I)alamin adenosyltransferase